MTYSLDGPGWQMRQFDTIDDETPYRVQFVRWVRCGERSDFAILDLLDDYLIQGQPLAQALVAPRHAGVDLRAFEPRDLPVHVHLLSTSADLRTATVVEVADLRRERWLTLEPTGWRDFPEARDVAEMNRREAAAEFERWREAARRGTTPD